MWIGHRKEIRKLTFRALALRRSEWWRANARNVSFRISLRWLIHIINPVDKTKLSYLRITPGHYANIGEKDTLFKDREPPKTIPYPAARTYRAHIGE